jgi:DNA ligase (NAD+)
MDDFDKYGIPRVCPVCGAKVEINSSGMPYCTNENCSQKVEHKFNKFFHVMNIDEAGLTFVHAMVTTGKVTKISEFLHLVDKSDTKIIEWAGGINGNKIIKNTADAISKPTPMSKFLGSFDFDGYGAKKIEVLDNMSLDDIFLLTPTNLGSKKNWSEETAAEFIEYLKKSKDDIISSSTYFPNLGKSDSMPLSSKFSGKSFCFTGKCETAGRKDLEKMVIDNGGTVSAVNKTLYALVTDDTESGSNKNEKAKQLGSKVISYDDFFSLLK